jgi:hypothetical protein
MISSPPVIGEWRVVISIPSHEEPTDGDCVALEKKVRADLLDLFEDASMGIEYVESSELMADEIVRLREENRRLRSRYMIPPPRRLQKD